MNKNPMPDVIVLLPGIMGSVLKKDDQVIWGVSFSSLSKALLTGGAALRQALALPEDPENEPDLGDGIVATGLMPDIHLIPGFWKIDGYSKIVDTIFDRFNVTEGENFFRFPYDWRRSNRVSARRLAEQSHDWLTRWRQKSGNDKARLVLVAHSMGGLVSSYFLECLEGWKITRALISFGTPYRGSLNALDTLANGVRKGPFGLFDLSILVRQLTAIYQLLPRYECYDPGDGSLVRVGETTGIPNLDAQRAAAALKFYREIDEAIVANKKIDAYRNPDTGYTIFPAVGIRQVTNQSARRQGDGVEMLQAYKGTDFGGDGTVPKVSATPIQLGNNPPAMYAATQHGSLQNAAAVLDNLEGILTGFTQDLSGFKAAGTSQLALEVGDLFWQGEEVTVRARPTGGNGQLTAAIQDRNSGRTVVSAPMQPDKDDWFRITVPHLPPGGYGVVVTGIDVEPAADVFAVADVKESEAAGSGNVRGGGFESFTKGGHLRRAMNETDTTQEVTISAQTGAQINLGGTGRVDYRIELTGEVQPLHVVLPSLAIDVIEDISIIVSSESTIVQIQGEPRQTVSPPASGQPRTNYFEFKAVSPGQARIAVMFRQGGSDLGTITLSVEVVAANASSALAAGTAVVLNRHKDDDLTLTILVKPGGNGAIRYDYTLNCEKLGLTYVTASSQQLPGGNGQLARNPVDYFNNLYKRVTQQIRSAAAAGDFITKLQGIGYELGKELFHPEVLKYLWPVRDRIRHVELVSWEPYIPWELVCLSNPDNGATDDKFLAEYGLIRKLSGKTPPQNLKLDSWSYLAAAYPLGSHPSIGGEVSYFTDDLPHRLSIQPFSIPPNFTALVDAIRGAAFDVIHISCHGKSEQDQIEDAELIIGDRPDQNGRPEDITVTPSDIRAQITDNFRGRRPLVFLNGCETGQVGALLTTWGGWPSVFVEAGAGIFVGTSWPVRDKPAALFAQVFYDNLLDGQTLVEAAGAARIATKAWGDTMGDASWLAFKVYGQPLARRS